MAITVPRYRILPLRGTYDALIAEFDEINDNEICYAIDRDQYYQREGNQLVQVGATIAQGLLAESAVQPVDLAPVAFSGDYNDLASLPSVLEVGDNISLLTNNIGYLTQLVANQLFVKYTDSINALADVDTATTAPITGNALLYNGTAWVPGEAADGADTTIDGGNLETGTAFGGNTTIDGGLIT